MSGRISTAMVGWNRVLLISATCFAVALAFWLIHQTEGGTPQSKSASPVTALPSTRTPISAIDRARRGDMPVVTPGATWLAKSKASPASKGIAMVSGPPVSAIDSEAHGEISALEVADAKQAVGRKFPLSPSVAQICATDPSEMCKALMELLNDLAAESRDILWAREMEERIERAVARPDPGKFTVRAVECRSTHCALEVSAPYEYYLGHFDDDPILSRSLYGPIVGVLGFEKGPAGEKVIVTTMGYERE